MSSDDQRAPFNPDPELGALLTLAGTMKHGVAREVEDQISSGQKELVNSTVLPCRSRECRESLEAAGVVFGESVPGDGLFVYVTLPEGWRKEGTDHIMWSQLLDDKGRERASIFYKAAFYDRDAFMNASARFRIHEEPDDEAGSYVARVKDGDDVVFSSQTHRYTDPMATYFEARSAAIAEASAWLERHHPSWEDPSAYWD